VRIHSLTPVLLVIIVLLAGSIASADLLYDHFGVTLSLGSQVTEPVNGNYYPFANGTFVPSDTGRMDYVTDDWYGSWSDTDFNDVTSGNGGTVPSGGEPYDVEALFFDNTNQDLFIVVVTSFDPPAGHDEPRLEQFGITPMIATGDLALDFGLNSEYTDGFSYDYGVNINNENRPALSGQNATSDGTTVGNAFYRTGNSDWYIGSDYNDVDAGGELTNFDPGWSSFGGTEIITGSTTVSYSQYDFGGGLQEGRYATYVIEVTIPRSLLPDVEDGDLIGISWVEGCRNDGGDAIVRLNGDVDVPEPCTMVLTGLGVLGMGWWRRRRSAA